MTEPLKLNTRDKLVTFHKNQSNSKKEKEKYIAIAISDYLTPSISL